MYFVIINFKKGFTIVFMKTRNGHSLDIWFTLMNLFEEDSS